MMNAQGTIVVPEQWASGCSTYEPNGGCFIVKIGSVRFGLGQTRTDLVWNWSWGCGIVNISHFFALSKICTHTFALSKLQTLLLNRSQVFGFNSLFYKPSHWMLQGGKFEMAMSDWLPVNLLLINRLLLYLCKQYSIMYYSNYIFTQKYI